MLNDTKPKVIFFDEQEEPQGDLAIALSKSVDLEIVRPPPLGKLEEIYFVDEKLPNGFLVDYRLAPGKMSDGSNIDYSGTMLLLALREALERKAPNSGISLIAISQYRYFRKEEEKEDIKKIRELADYIIYKEDALNEPEHTNRRIESFIRDLPILYRIKQKKRSWAALVDVFCPPDKAYVSDILLNSNHPLSASPIPLDERVSEVEKSISGAEKGPSHQSRASWTCRDATKWIVYTILEYSGVLYDSLYASTLLGLELSAFEKSEWIHEIFDLAKYRGIFHQMENYWWKYKILEIAYDLLGKKNLGGPLAENFIKVCPSKAKVKPNKCVYSNESGADKVCYFLKKPVRNEYSLEYHIEDRPITMDAVYISRTAYETSDEINEELLTPSAKSKLREWYKR